ncbi:lipid A-modifier LpxR family protein [Phaeovulum sp. W22_SRMD_FR3]|uniref:lipid A-modifier LpxR family protein n=1 Tax=Phaeovulum sp. W22_SRMD_FR3 TaxID=3240274 RepID=UPI003F95D341
MRTQAFALVLGLISGISTLGAAAHAEGLHFSDRVTLGVGRLFDNDFLGDNKDRWQTGGYSLSVMRGEQWDGALPDHPFEIMEYRFGGRIIAPSKLRNPAPGDRPYAGLLEFLAQTHYQMGQIETSGGLGLTAVGPGTGIGRLQSTLHNLLGASKPNVLDDQLDNHLYPVVTGEMAHSYELGGAQLRPFIEGRAGDETLVRAGFDISFGARERGALWLRDEVTGQRYVGISGNSQPGVAFTLGGDMAYVSESAWLPGSAGVTMENHRSRLRAGVEMRGTNVGLFYGVTWLSKEFKEQPEDQVVGSLRLRVNF